jgi:hypothetical protein
MPDPGLAGPDLCSIRTADGQEEPARAVGGSRTAAGHPPADDYPPAPLTSGIDRAIRLSTAEARQASPLPDPAGTPVTASP